jgi:DNA-3-methyladenine glycosylase II
MPALTRRQLRAHFASVDPVMAALIEAAGPYRLRAVACPSPFKHLTQAIISQQISGRAAAAILGRFVALFGMSAAAEEFPAPESILAEHDSALRAAGLSASKVAAVRDLATKTLAGVVPDSAVLQQLPDQQIIERLTVVRGIGAWTVQMMLMFQLGRADVLPINDYGVRNGFRIAYRRRDLPTPGELQRYGERWTPYRSAAAWYLWRAVDLQKAGNESLKALPAAPRGAGAKRRPRPGARTR